jgi:hypothetical protein
MQRVEKKRQKDGTWVVRTDARTRMKGKEIIYQEVFQRNMYSEGEIQYLITKG